MAHQLLTELNPPSVQITCSCGKGEVLDIELWGSELRFSVIGGYGSCMVDPFELIQAIGELMTAVKDKADQEVEKHG